MKGWKHESYRHSLASRGIRTSFAQIKPGTLAPSNLLARMRLGIATEQVKQKSGTQVAAAIERGRGSIYTDPNLYKLTPSEQTELEKVKVMTSLTSEQERLQFLDDLGKSIIEKEPIRPGESVEEYLKRGKAVLQSMGLPESVVAKGPGDKTYTGFDVAYESFSRNVANRSDELELESARKFGSAQESLRRAQMSPYAKAKEDVPKWSAAKVAAIKERVGRVYNPIRASLSDFKDDLDTFMEKRGWGKSWRTYRDEYDAKAKEEDVNAWKQQQQKQNPPPPPNDEGMTF